MKHVPYRVWIGLVITLVEGIILGGALSGALSQDKPKYEPTENQALHLENTQLKAKLAQQAWSAKAYQLPEFSEANKALNALLAECTAVVKENKWPDAVTCNPDTLKFAAAKQVEHKVDTAKPAEPEKK
jgi:regulator of replication initiation timing